MAQSLDQSGPRQEIKAQPSKLLSDLYEQNSRPNQESLTWITKTEGVFNQPISRQTKLQIQSPLNKVDLNAI